jgi:hypothetical protein
MSPTTEIARDLREADIIKRMGRDSYQKLLRNEEEARKRAAKYKEQRTCTR